MKRIQPITLGSIIIAVLGVGIALVVAGIVTRVQLHSSEMQLRHQAEAARAMLVSRLGRERARLLAARGFYLASKEITPKAWSTFADALYDGRSDGRTLLHFIYAPAGRLDIPTLQLAEVGVHAGAVNPRPSHPGDFYCVADRIWPATLDVKVLGRNPCASRDRKLFRLALHNPGIIASRELRIRAPNGAGLPGLVLVTAEHTPHLDGARPRGWVAETVPLRALFGGLGHGQDPVAVSVYDVSNGQEHLLYRHGSVPVSPVSWGERAMDWAREIQVTQNLAGADRHWRLVINGRVEGGWAPVATAGAGSLISVLLAALFFVFARTGRRAKSLADAMTEDLSASRELLASITNNIRDGIYRGVPEAGIIYVNRSLARLFGFSSEAQMISNQGAIRYASPSRRDELRDKLYSVGSYEDEEVEYVKADGSHFVGLNSAWAVRDAESKVRYYDGVVTDITDRKTAERQIEFMAHFDRLTGLPNRTLLEDRFRQTANLAARGGFLCAILFIDLDNFKDINDLHGHDIGDLFLVEVASRLRECVREEDTVARFGGDEFVILASRVPNVQAVTRIAHQVVDTVSQSYEIAGLELHTTPSVGIALYPQDGTDLTSLSQNADAAMYQVKKRGRAGIAYFTQRLNEQARRQVAIENALRHAIERGEMSLAFQPRATIADGRISGVEVLARWTHPDWGRITPAEFIPAAERTGLIVGSGKWVLAQALEEWKRWSEHSDHLIRVGVNVSARQLRERGFADTVAEALKVADVPGEALELEITETMLVERLQASEETLDQLKGLNVRLALDDFGIGYSSLGYLKRFDIDVIKIDQSFVRDILSDPNDAAIVRAIVAIGRDLGVELVAEGVETEQQLAVLRLMRCEAVQGYFLARPMPADALVAFLDRVRTQGLPPPFPR